MQLRIILTTIGPDRKGLVDALSKTVLEHEGNWLDSRLCRLGGQFAGIVSVSLPEANLGAFSATLDSLESSGLRTSITRDVTSAPAPVLRTMRLSVVGQDRPGIIRKLAAALVQNGANVEELTSSQTSAPMSGETLFKATFVVGVPVGKSEEDLAQQLEAVAADLMVEVQVGRSPAL